MYIWHKRLSDGKYHMRINMALYPSLDRIIEVLGRVYKDIVVKDMGSVNGNEGLFRVHDKNGEIIGEAYDPDVYRVWKGMDKEMVVPAYKDFYDETGKFSKDLFIKNYKGEI